MQRDPSYCMRDSGCVCVGGGGGAFSEGDSYLCDRSLTTLHDGPHTECVDPMYVVITTHTHMYLVCAEVMYRVKGLHCSSPYISAFRM